MLKIIKPIDFFRVGDWVHHTGIALLGYFALTGFAFSTNILMMIIISSLYLAHGYSFNDYFDEGGKNTDLYLSMLPFILNMFLSALVSNLMFMMVVSGTMINILYSVFRLKEKPITNYILNSFGFSLLFLMGWHMNKVLDLTAVILFLYVSLIFVISQAFHTEKHDELNTTKNNTKIILVTSMTVLFILSILLNRLTNIGPLFVIFTLIYVLSISTFLRNTKNLGSLRTEIKYLTLLHGTAILFVLSVG